MLKDYIIKHCGACMYDAPKNMIPDLPEKLQKLMAGQGMITIRKEKLNEKFK